MLKKYLLSLSVIYSFVLIALSLIKISPLTKAFPSNSDKVFHGLAFCIFTLLWFSSFYFKLKLRKVKAITFAALLSIGTGIFIELIQGILTETRQSDFNDVIANVIGTIVAVILVTSMKKGVLKNINSLLL